MGDIARFPNLLFDEAPRRAERLVGVVGIGLKSALLPYRQQIAGSHA